MVDEPRDDSEEPMQIGELARASGPIVRTLRYYDRLGLLVPTARDENGYRRYGRSEIEHLYRIRALKALGFGLQEISSVLQLSDGALELRELVARHLAGVRQRRASLASLENRLGLLLDALASSATAESHQLL